MGFLIFAFRKLCLKKEINQKNARLMSLCVHEQRIHNQMSIMTQTNASMQQALGMVIGGFQRTAQGAFVAQNDAEQSNIFKQIKDDRAIIKANEGKTDADSVKKYNDANTDLTNKQNITDDQMNSAAKKFEAYQASNEIGLLLNGALNKGFEVMDDAQKNSLEAQDQAIDLEKATLESQLKSLNYELEGVEKSETDAAKKSAPTFGLA